MKKRFCFMLLACFVLSISMMGCAQSADESTAGGYTEDRELKVEELSLFEQVMVEAEASGVSYEPTLVATQVVAGTNYRFTATATPMAMEPESYTVYVYIYEPLDGASELKDIVTVE